MRTGLILTVALLASCGGGPGPIPQPTAQQATVTTQSTPRTLPTVSLPDLIVNSALVDLEIIGDCVRFDSEYPSVHIEIANIGSRRAGFFGVAVGPHPSEFIDEGLEPGESLSLSVSISPTEVEGLGLDQQLRTVTVDYLDQVQESNEYNNTWSIRPDLQAGIQFCAAPEPVLVADVWPIPLLPAGRSLNFHQIDMVDASRGWGVVGNGEEDQHIVRTEDGGKTWFDVSPPELTYGVDECGAQATLKVVDASTAWVGYANAHEQSASDCYRTEVTDLWKTEDGGRTWQLGSFVQRNQDAIGGGLDGSGFPTLEFVDPQYGWALRDFFTGAGSSAVELYRTIDGGRTWELLPEGYLHRFTGIDFLDLKYGWVTKSYPFGYIPPLSLAQTHNGGATWEIGELPLPVDPQGYHSCTAQMPSLRSSTEGQLTVVCRTVEFAREWYAYETSDGGRTWQITRVPEQPDQYVSASVGWRGEIAPAVEGADPDTESLELYWTYDRGQNWAKVGTAALLRGGELDFVSTQVGWAVTKLGERENALIQTFDGGRSWQPMQPTSVESLILDDRSQPPRISPPTGLEAISPQNVADLVLIQALQTKGVTSLAVYPPRNLLLTSHQDGAVSFWDLTGAHYAREFWPHSDWIYDLTVAEIGGMFATASKDGQLRFWLFYGNREIETFTGLGGEVASVAASPGGHIIASAGQAGVISVWELETINFVSIGPPVKELLGHTGWVWDLALSSDFQILASGSVDRTIRLWEIASGESIETLTAHKATVGAVAFSPDVSRLASASWDGTVILWDTATWSPLSNSNEHTGRVYQVSFSPDGSLLASAAADGAVILWNAASGERLRTLQVGSGAARAVLFTPDGSLLLAGSDDGFLRLWGVQP